MDNGFNPIEIYESDQSERDNSMQNVTRLNYDEINLITKKIHDESEDFAQLHASTRQKMASLRSEWEGEAADKFFEQMEVSLLPAIKKLSQGLVTAQDVINNIAKTIQEADQETASFFKSGEDFGAGAFGGALGAGAVGLAAGGEDFGAGKFGQAGNDTPAGSTAAAGVPGAQAGSASSSSGIEFAKTATETPQEAAKTEAAATAAAEGGGGGGGGAGGSGLSGDLKGLGLGLGGQPASNASVGGSAGGAESLPDHNFGSSGSSGAGSGGQGSGGGSSAGSGGGQATPAGNEGVAAGVAGVAGSAAVGAAAKVLKDKKDNG